MPTVRLAPVTAAAIAALIWGGAFWVAWPSDRLRPAAIAAAAAFALVYTLNRVRSE